MPLSDMDTRGSSRKAPGGRAEPSFEFLRVVAGMGLGECYKTTAAWRLTVGDLRYGLSSFTHLHPEQPQ